MLYLSFYKVKKRLFKPLSLNMLNHTYYERFICCIYFSGTSFLEKKRCTQELMHFQKMKHFFTAHTVSSQQTKLSTKNVLKIKCRKKKTTNK